LFLLPLLLALTACGGPSTGKSAGAAEVFDTVKVSGGSDEKAPKVEFDSPMEVTAPAVKTLVEGEGKAIKAGQQITFNAAFFNAEDGSKLGDTYKDGEPRPLPVDDTLKKADAELYEVLIESKVGAQIGYTRPVEEPAEGQEAQPQSFVVLKVISAKDPAPEPKILSPEDVSKLDKDGKLPTFTFAKDGAPEVTIPDNEPSEDLVVKVLKEGTGEVVKETDTITAKYAGWRWEDGEQFDSSFERGEPAEFPLNQVIEGWTKGLSGQKVGSQVLLVIPAPWAYGEAAPEGSPSGTLVFFVEITKKAAAK
jgi:peptidylprolyl isomerase